MKALSEKIGYGLGDMSSSMFWKIFSYYLPIFYTNIFGLQPAHAAMLLLITKLYDAVSDPVMGIIADRTRSRWGRYRPWLLWIAVPFGIIGTLSFYTPEASYTAKHVYAYVMYILMMSVYTAINVPYGAMLGVVSNDSREKSIFSSFRMFFAFVGSFLAMGIFGFFEQSAGGDVANASPQEWTLWVGGIGLLCTLLFIGCFALTREHVKPAEPAKNESGTIGKDLKALGRNVPWWLLLGGCIGLLLFGALRGGTVAYYFSYVLGTNILFSCAIFLFIGEVSQMVGVLITVPLSERIGKCRTFIVSLTLMALLSTLVWFVPVTTAGFWVLSALQVLICVCIGVVSPLMWSMYADVADYSERVNGRSSTGLIFSSSSMAQKFGGALGGFLLLSVLGAFGFNKDLAEQAPETLTAIRALMSWVPAIGCVLGIICLNFYPLDKKQNKA